VDSSVRYVIKVSYVLHCFIIEAETLSNASLMAYLVKED
jgi:hypothetical protein